MIVDRSVSGLVHEFLQFVFNQCGSALDDSPEKVKLIVKKLVEDFDEKPPHLRLAAQFAQFLGATLALSQAVDNGDLSACGDWVAWALAERIEDGHQVVMHIGRLHQFIHDPSIFAWDKFEPLLVAYLSGFYYYARNRTAMKTIGEDLWPLAESLVMHLVDSRGPNLNTQEAYLASSMLTWAAKESHKLAENLTPRVENWISSETLTPQVRKIFCLTLATNGGRFSSSKPEVWAKRVLQDFPDQVVGEQRAQMLATVFYFSGDLAVADQILEEIGRLQSCQQRAMDAIAFIRRASLRMDTIQPYFNKCLSIPRVDYVLHGLEHWYQIRHAGSSIDPSSILFTLPFGEHGYSVVTTDKKFELKRDGQSLLVDIVRQTNEFLGTAHTVAYADNSTLKIPERPGVPDVNGQTDRWFSTLKEAYCPSITLDAEPTCQLAFPAMGHPIQAAQLDAWGKTWPIASSLHSPHADRAIKSVAIWSGAGTMCEEMELEVLRFAFEKNGAKVDVFSPETCNATDFIAAYSQDVYDIFWVASHGEFDHWSPHNVQLQISRQRTAITLQDLLRVRLHGEARRLLVLNVCDGARFDEIGWIPRIGLAAGLAGPRQAAISHLWPVMAFPSAAFASYLAYFLSTNSTFFDAFTKSLNLMRKTSTDVAAELRSLYGGNFDLFDRLSRCDEDFRPIQYWGSAAFFQ